MPPETLFDQEAHARRADPQTSHQAAAAVTPGLPELQALVERYAVRWPEGFLDVDLVAAHPDEGPSTLRTRRAELAARNIILDSMRRRTPEGASSPHTIWIHRSFVSDAPPISKPAKPASGEDRAQALDMAIKLEREAADLKARGFAIFGNFLADCAQMMRRLAA